MLAYICYRNRGTLTAAHAESGLKNPNNTCHCCTETCEVLEVFENKRRGLFIWITGENDYHSNNKGDNVEYQSAF